MINDGDTIDAIRTFLTSCPPIYDFPLGGSDAIPIEPEKRLLEALARIGQFELAEIPVVRQALTIRDAYSLVTFTTRMAIFSVRSGSTVPILTTIAMIVIDDGLVDWRDVLTALSIIEDCAARMSLDIGELLNSVIPLATEKRRHSIRNGYLGRPVAMRSPAVMGFVPSGENASFLFVRRRHG
jgi:hypothetical protein